MPWMDDGCGRRWWVPRHQVEEDLRRARMWMAVVLALIAATLAAAAW